MSDYETINISDYKNTFFNILNFIVHPMAMLIAIPIFIFYLGIEIFGIWILINSIISHLRFFDPGLGNSIIKFVSKYRSKNDILNINKIINNIFFIFLLIVLILLFISFIIFKFDGFILFFNIHSNYVLMVREALFYSVILLCIKLLESLLLSVYKAYERFDYFAIFSIISRLFLIGTQIFAVIYFSSLAKVFLYSCYSASIVLIFEFFLLKKIFKNITFSYTLINKQTFQEIFSFGFWSWIYSCLSIFSNQIDKIIVVKLTNPIILGYYSIAFFVFNNLHALLSSSVSWLFPKISRLSELKVDIKKIYYKCQFILTLVGTVGILFIYAFDELILTLWIDHEVYINTHQYIKLFLLSNLLLIITIPPYYFLNATGFVKINTMLKIFGVSLTIVSMFIFNILIGIYGIIIARSLAPLIIGSISRNYVNSKCFNQSNMFYGFQMLIPLLLIICCVLFYEFNITHFGLVTINLFLILISFYYFYFKKMKDFENV